MHRTTILLPDDLDRRLTETARRHRSSRTEVLRQALQSYLDAEVRPPLKSLGVARLNDPNVNSENIKQVIRAEWREKALRGE